MIPKSLRSFIAKLHTATDDGDLQWLEGAPDAYYCNHRSFELHLSHRFDHETGESAFVFLMKSAGREASFFVTDDEADYTVMQNLYASVGVLAAGFENVESAFFGSNP